MISGVYPKLILAHSFSSILFSTTKKTENAEFQNPQKWPPTTEKTNFVLKRYPSPPHTPALNDSSFFATFFFDITYNYINESMVPDFFGPPPPPPFRPNPWKPGLKFQKRIWFVHCNFNLKKWIIFFCCQTLYFSLYNLVYSIHSTSEKKMYSKRCRPTFFFLAPRIDPSYRYRPMKIQSKEVCKRAISDFAGLTFWPVWRKVLLYKEAIYVFPFICFFKKRMSRNPKRNSQLLLNNFRNIRMKIMQMEPSTTQTHEAFKKNEEKCTFYNPQLNNFCFFKLIFFVLRRELYCFFLIFAPNIEIWWQTCCW